MPYINEHDLILRAKREARIMLALTEMQTIAYKHCMNVPAFRKGVLRIRGDLSEELKSINKQITPAEQRGGRLKKKAEPTRRILEKEEEI